MRPDLKKIQFRLLTLFVSLIFIATFYLVFILTEQYSFALRQNAGYLVSTSNHQMEININDYFSKVETTTSMMFSE